MVTQLLIAYGAGMVLTIGMEIAKVLKARRLNRRAAMQTAFTPAQAPSFDSTPRVDHVNESAANEPAANEPVLMRAAG